MRTSLTISLCFALGWSTAARAQVSFGSYVGDGANTRSINTGLLPNLLVVRGEDSTSTWVRVTGMANSEAKVLVGAVALSGAPIRSTTSAGFSLQSTGLNVSGVRYHWLGSSTQAGRLASSSYVGTAAARAVALGFTPELVLLLPSDAAESGWVTGSGPAVLTSGASPAAGLESISGTDLSLSADSSFNRSGVTYYAVAFSNTPGIQLSASYLGDGVLDRLISVGAQPSWVLMLPAGQPAVVRPGSAAFDQTFPGGVGGVFANGIKDLVSSGFVVGSDPSVNAAGTSYRYLAFLVDGGASTDAGVDAGGDAGADAGADAGIAGVDAGLDAGADAGLQGASDAGALDGGDDPESPDGPHVYRSGCGCTASSAAGLWWILGVLVLSAARRCGSRCRPPWPRRHSLPASVRWR